MSDDRIRELELIGFQWLNKCGVSTEELNDLWYERFQELKKYEKTHGNCNFPVRSGSLGNWVKKQRWKYKLLKEGKSSAMSDDRIRKLESIDF